MPLEVADFLILLCVLNLSVLDQLVVDTMLSIDDVTPFRDLGFLC